MLTHVMNLFHLRMFTSGAGMADGMMARASSDRGCSMVDIDIGRYIINVYIRL